MPFVAQSQYRPPRLLSNAHAQTAYAAAFRQLIPVIYQRERITTADEDFLDLDWSDQDKDRLVIITHGFAGNSQQLYMQGMAKAFNRKGYAALCWNQRGCSGEPNLKPYGSHGGSTDDLDTVIKHALSKGRYREIVLVGFSLGGNITLKYLGERGPDVYPEIKSAVTFSAPIDFASCANMVSENRRAYFHLLFYAVKQIISQKANHFPDQINYRAVARASTVREFDNLYTAPLHGFLNAEDYWAKSSCKPLLHRIRVPSLLINAKDDPLLALDCYPVEIAEQSSYFHFEMPNAGGHVGFVAFNENGEYWSESRALEFASGLRPEPNP